MKADKTIVILAALAAYASHSRAATLTGVTPNSASAATSTAITFDNGSVGGVGSFLPVTNRGTVSSGLVESKWSPEKLTLSYNLGGSSGTANVTYGAQNLTFSHLDYRGTRTATFGQTNSTGTPWASLTDASSGSTPRGKWTLLPGNEFMERRASGSGQTAILRLETDLVQSAGTIEMNGQAGTSDGTTQVLNNSPIYLWSASYNSGATIADFPVMRVGGTSHKLELFKRPADFAAIGTTTTPVIVLDPDLQKITINNQPVLTTTAGGNATLAQLSITGSLQVGPPGYPIPPLYSATFGENIVSGSHSISVGGANGVAGEYSTAFGHDHSVGATTVKSGGITPVNSPLYGGFISGGESAVYSSYASSLGYGNLVQGEAATAIGYANQADGNFSAALGLGLKTSVDASVAVGKWNRDPVPGIFVVGNGTNSVRSNAMRVLEDGTILIKPQSDLSMGNFTGGDVP